MRFGPLKDDVVRDIVKQQDIQDAASLDTLVRLAGGSPGQALALAEPRCMRPLMAHCHHGLGQLYCRAGKRQKAHEYLCTANTMYREMGMVFWLKKAEMEMLQLE